MQDEAEKLGRLVYDWDMRLIMNDERLQTIEQVRQFLEGSEAVEFRDLTAKEKYYWIEEASRVLEQEPMKLEFLEEALVA